VISLQAKDLRHLSEDELADRLRDTRKELFNIRFQSATGALENTTRLRLARREIARILTVQLEQASSAKAQG
jgi:large subunit ribosomal protein L29